MVSEIFQNPEQRLPPALTGVDLLLTRPDYADLVKRPATTTMYTPNQLAGSV